MKSTLYFMLSFLLILFAANPGSAQNLPTIEHEVTGELKPWTDETPHYGGKDFHFIVLTDNAGSMRRGIYKEAIEKSETLHPSFVISVGDMIGGGSSRRDEPYRMLNEEWEEFMTWINPLSAPFFFVPGNHDTSGEIRKEVWHSRFGPNYYYFKYMDVLFVVLDSTNPDQEQLDWLKTTLAAHTNVRWTFLLQHHPYWIYENHERWVPVWDIIKDRKNLTVFGGHVHKYFHNRKNGINLITLATTGGGSHLLGPNFGEFDHMMWVTVTDPEPKMINMSLDGLLPYDFRSGDMAQSFHEFTRKNVVLAEPLVIKDHVFTEGSWILSVKNPWVEPLRFKAYIEAQEDIGVSPRTFTVFVPPHQTTTQTITISSAEALPVNKLQAVSLHWEGFYDQHNKEPYQFADILRLAHGGENTSIKTDSMIDIDGDLNDWGELRYTVTNPGDIDRNETAWRGPHDCHFAFDVAHDDEWIYVAAKVTDDEIKLTDLGSMSDTLGIRIRAAGETIGESFNYTLRYLEEPETAENDTRKIAVQKTDHELIYEFAVLRSKLGTDTSSIQLNIVVNDKDDRDERFGRSILTWKPYWNTNDPEDEPKLGVFQLDSSR